MGGGDRCVVRFCLRYNARHSREQSPPPQISAAGSEAHVQGVRLSRDIVPIVLCKHPGQPAKGGLALLYSLNPKVGNHRRLPLGHPEAAPEREGY